MRAFAAFLLLTALLGACARDPGASREPAPWQEWQSPELRGHPLVGRVIDVAARREVAPSALVERALASRFTLLGEKHDNPDHHRLQAWVLARLVAAGRRPAVAFEMLRHDTREALAAHRKESPRDVDALGRAVVWDKSGWPDWRIYRPVFATALGAELPVEPADLERAILRRVSAEGFAALGEGRASELGLDVPLRPELRESLAETIREAHCGMAPESHLDGMIAVQRARDAWLADRLLRAATHDGAVLIAGNGHVERDAVPAYISRRAPQAAVLAVAFLEVEADALDMSALLDGEEPGGFDFLWLTPRLDSIDPCTKFREQLERLRK